MKLRTAIKICRSLHGPRAGLVARPTWRWPTILKARSVCRRHWRDSRVPVIPTDEELGERWTLMLSMIGEALIKDEAKRKEFL